MSASFPSQPRPVNQFGRFAGLPLGITTLVAAPAAGLSIYVQTIMFNTGGGAGAEALIDNGTTILADLTIGAGGSANPFAWVTFPNAVALGSAAPLRVNLFGAAGPALVVTWAIGPAL